MIRITHQSGQSSEGVAQFISTLAADREVPYIAAEEATGALVKALVLEAPGKNLIAYNEWLTPREMAAAFFEATGIKAEAVQLPPGKSHVPLPEGIQRQMDETWAYYKEFGYEGRDDSTVIHPHQVSLHTSFIPHHCEGRRTGRLTRGFVFSWVTHLVCKLSNSGSPSSNGRIFWGRSWQYMSEL